MDGQPSTSTQLGSALKHNRNRQTMTAKDKYGYEVELEWIARNFDGIAHSKHTHNYRPNETHWNWLMLSLM